MATKDTRLARAGVSGYNKPKATPSHPTKSHVVVAKSGESRVTRSKPFVSVSKASKAHPKKRASPKPAKRGENHSKLGTLTTLPRAN
jgi:hypothetical protein